MKGDSALLMQSFFFSLQQHKHLKRFLKRICNLECTNEVENN